MLEAKAFPQNMGEIEIDSSDMKRCLVSGLFLEHVDMGGVTRNFYTYLTPGLAYD